MQPHTTMTRRTGSNRSVGAARAGRPTLLELAYGDTLDLTVGPMAKRLGEAIMRMLAYNGSIPNPPSRSSRAARSSSTSPITATWIPPCTGTACAWRTGMTACRTRPRRPCGWVGGYLLLGPDSRSLRATMA
jgi:hypothetical protein